MNIRRKAQKCVNREYWRFKRKLIRRKSREDIWQACEKIHFFLCLKEYFELNDKIPREYLELAQAEPALLEKAWRAYLMDESLEYRTWPEIEGLLETVLMKWKLPEAV